MTPTLNIYVLKSYCGPKVQKHRKANESGAFPVDCSTAGKSLRAWLHCKSVKAWVEAYAFLYAFSLVPPSYQLVSYSPESNSFPSTKHWKNQALLIWPLLLVNIMHFLAS